MADSFPIKGVMNTPTPFSSDYSKEAANPFNQQQPMSMKPTDQSVGGVNMGLGNNAGPSNITPSYNVTGASTHWGSGIGEEGGKMYYDVGGRLGNLSQLENQSKENMTNFQTPEVQQSQSDIQQYIQNVLSGKTQPNSNLSIYSSLPVAGESTIPVGIKSYMPKDARVEIQREYYLAPATDYTTAQLEKIEVGKSSDVQFVDRALATIAGAGMVGIASPLFAASGEIGRPGELGYQKLTTEERALLGVTAVATYGLPLVPLIAPVLTGAVGLTYSSIGVVTAGGGTASMITGGVTPENVAQTAGGFAMAAIPLFPKAIETVGYYNKGQQAKLLLTPQESGNIGIRNTIELGKLTEMNIRSSIRDMPKLYEKAENILSVSKLETGTTYMKPLDVKTLVYGDVGEVSGIGVGRFSAVVEKRMPIFEEQYNIPFGKPKLNVKLEPTVPDTYGVNVESQFNPKTAGFKAEDMIIGVHEVYATPSSPHMKITTTRGIEYTASSEIMKKEGFSNIITYGKSVSETGGMIDISKNIKQTRTMTMIENPNPSQVDLGWMKVDVESSKVIAYGEAGISNKMLIEGGKGVFSVYKINTPIKSDSDISFDHFKGTGETPPKTDVSLKDANRFSNELKNVENKLQHMNMIKTTSAPSMESAAKTMSPQTISAPSMESAAKNMVKNIKGDASYVQSDKKNVLSYDRTLYDKPMQSMSPQTIVSMVGGKTITDTSTMKMLSSAKELHESYKPIEDTIKEIKLPLKIGNIRINSVSEDILRGTTRITSQGTGLKYYNPPIIETKEKTDLGTLTTTTTNIFTETQKPIEPRPNIPMNNIPIIPKLRGGSTIGGGGGYGSVKHTPMISGKKSGGIRRGIMSDLLSINTSVAKFGTGHKISATPKNVARFEERWSRQGMAGVYPTQEQIDIKPRRSGIRTYKPQNRKLI